MQQKLKYLLCGCLVLLFGMICTEAFSDNSQKSTVDQSVILAKKAAPAKKKKPVKEKDITREVKVGQRSTKVSFEDTDIAGERRGGLGSVIEEGQVDKEVDLIKIRYSWHPEMKASTSSLETGKTE